MSAPPPPASAGQSRPDRLMPRTGLRELIQEIAQVSVTEQDTEAVLRRVCGQLTGVHRVTGCAAVLFDGSTGAVGTLVASHPEAEQLTWLVAQLELGVASPAIRAGQDTAVQDLTSSVRAGLAGAARRVGLPITAVVALRRSEQLVGCLQLYSRDLATFTDGLLDELAPLAEVLGTTLGNLEAYRHTTSLVARLTTALDRQGPIDQARGLLAERHRIDLDAAYRMLREQATRQATTIGAVAAAVVGEFSRLVTEATGPRNGAPTDRSQPAGRAPEDRAQPGDPADDTSLPEQRGGPPDMWSPSNG